MIILGADISYTRTGLVWINDKIELLYSRTLSFPIGDKRYEKAVRRFHQALSDGPRPDAAYHEGAIYSKREWVTGLHLAQLQGAFFVACDLLGVHYTVRDHTPSPSAVKREVTGDGRADKHKVAMVLAKQYGIAFDPSDCGCKGGKQGKHDLSDAAAVALWGLRRGEL